MTTPQKTLIAHLRQRLIGLGAVVVETSVIDPAGATMGTSAFFASFGEHLSMLIDAVPDQDGYVFRLMPLFDGVTYEVVTRLVAATPGMAWVAGASAVPPSIAHPTPPTLSTPTEGTTGVGVQTRSSLRVTQPSTSSVSRP